MQGKNGASIAFSKILYKLSEVTFPEVLLNWETDCIAFFTFI